MFAIKNHAYNEKLGAFVIDFDLPLTSIGEAAFKETDITSVTLPTSVTTIGKECFRGCSSLCGIDLHDGITTIGEGALETLTIPESATSIGYRAFYYCRILQGMTLGHDTPPTLGKEVFMDCDKMWYISVPKGTASTYKSTENWEDWTNFNGKENIFYEY